ncbi:MAG: hypothetical protein GMKNLPBB_00481 [Myxococcota bacterium]|nr:hypothetical protein [Myxococcota bacterium]
MNPAPVQPDGGGVILHIQVQPNARATRCVGLHGDALKIQLAAPPADGQANAALVDFLARALDRPKAAVRLLSGQSSRRKRIAVSGVEASVVWRALGLEPPA